MTKAAGELKILIVDDDEDIRHVETLLCEQLGIAADSVEDTSKAKKWLSGKTPDLILLDIMMPDGNGLDLCRWIRSRPNLKTVPIIIGTGLKDEESAQDALELGAIDFIRKPFSTEALKEKIRRVLKMPDPA